MFTNKAQGSRLTPIVLPVRVHFVSGRTGVTTALSAYEKRQTANETDPSTRVSCLSAPRHK